MLLATLLDRLALIACGLFVAMVLAWIAAHPLVLVFLQLALVVGVLAWRFGEVQPDEATSP